MRRVGLAGRLRSIGKNPGAVLDDALQSDDPMLRARATKAIGELGLVNLVSESVKHLFFRRRGGQVLGGMVGSTLDGNPSAMATLRSIAELPGPHQEQATILAARRMEHAEAKAWVKKLAQNPETLRQNDHCCRCDRGS